MSRLKPALIKCNAIKMAWSKQSNISAARHTEHTEFHCIRGLMGKDETPPPSSEQKNVWILASVRSERETRQQHSQGKSLRCQPLHHIRIKYSNLYKNKMKWQPTPQELKYLPQVHWLRSWNQKPKREEKKNKLESRTKGFLNYFHIL